MVGTFPWQYRVFKIPGEENVVLALNCRKNVLTCLKSNQFSYDLHTAVHQFGKPFLKLVNYSDVQLPIGLLDLGHVYLREYPIPCEALELVFRRVFI